MNDAEVDKRLKNSEIFIHAALIDIIITNGTIAYQFI